MIGCKKDEKKRKARRDVQLSLRILVRFPPARQHQPCRNPHPRIARIISRELVR